MLKILFKDGYETTKVTDYMTFYALNQWKFIYLTVYWFKLWFINYDIQSLDYTAFK